jgi:hypothetical protein
MQAMKSCKKYFSVDRAGDKAMPNLPQKQGRRSRWSTGQAGLMLCWESELLRPVIWAWV